MFSSVFVACLPSLAVPLFGPAMVERGRQMRGKDAARVLQKDHRSPVIYLRSFQDDDVVDPRVPSIFSVFLFWKFRPPFLKNRYEDTFLKHLWKIGPVVCLGRPREQYPGTGGARLYVRDSEWQEAVAFLLSQAAAVVFMVGHTGSLWWEIHQTIKLVPLDRILFFFPYTEKPQFRQAVFRKYWAFIGLGLSTKRMLRRMQQERQERYQLFCEKVQPLVTGELPSALGTSLFLDFADDGAPRLLKTWRQLDAAIMWRFSEYSWTQVDLRFTLRPFLKKMQR